MRIMYCSKCEESIAENQKFCPSCGAENYSLSSKTTPTKPSLQTSSILGIDAIWIILVAYFLTPLITIANGDFRYWGWLIPLIIFILEKKSSMVKYNAAQSLVLHLIRLAVLMAVLRIPAYHVVVMMFKSFVVQFSYAILYILSADAAAKAYRGQPYKLPVIGSIVDRLFGPYLATEE